MSNSNRSSTQQNQQGQQKTTYENDQDRSKQGSFKERDQGYQPPRATKNESSRQNSDGHSAESGYQEESTGVSPKGYSSRPDQDDDSNDGMEGRKPTQGVKNQKKDDYKTSGSTHGHKKAS